MDQVVKGGRTVVFLVGEVKKKVLQKSSIRFVSDRFQTLLSEL
jgi:hypothetical protein